jgi:hypothetical protein
MLMVAKRLRKLKIDLDEIADDDTADTLDEDITSEGVETETTGDDDEIPDFDGSGNGGGAE